MQTIQNHVVSLDLAKKLVEVGIKIESEFWWPPAGDVVLSSYDFGDGVLERKDCIPAPLASELGELMTDDSSYAIFRYGRVWRAFGGEKIHHEDADTMPDAMAKMLIYLKEKGLI